MSAGASPTDSSTRVSASRSRTSLVDGPPWNIRVALRAHDFVEGADGDEYNNRLVAFLEIRWGRLVRWEDYEDTERVATWDQRKARVHATDDA